MRKVKLLQLVIACLFLLGGIATAASAQVLVLDDNFTNLNNWTTGTNTYVNASPTVSLDGVNDRVWWVQDYDYIETVAEFGGDVSIEFNVARGLTSTQSWDFLVEFVGTESMCAMVRLRYGVDNNYRIALGPAPSTDSQFLGVNVTDGAYQQAATTAGSPYEGTGKFTYQDGKIKFEFTGRASQKVETPWVETTTFTGNTKIRIWATGEDRYLNWVKVYAPSGATPTTGGVVVIPMFD